MNIIEEILMKFSTNNSLYIGEKVTISEHMIQSAMLAEKNSCSDNLICACLLHDYGHFILDDPDTLVSQKKDGEHEEIAYNYLKDFFVKEDYQFEDFGTHILKGFEKPVQVYKLEK